MQKLIAILAVCALALGLAFKTASAATNISKSVVIDAGHGGTDFGSTACPTLAEKDANLQIALILQQRLQASGYRVDMTRTTDVTLSNADRYNFANQTGDSAFVSIHLNGSTNPSVDGTEGLWGKRNKDLAIAKVVHSAEAASLGIPDLGVTNFADGILLKTIMPATLTESVFISNTNECALLSDRTMNRQTQVAQALYQGIVNWFATN